MQMTKTLTAITSPSTASSYRGVPQGWLDDVGKATVESHMPTSYFELVQMTNIRRTFHSIHHAFNSLVQIYRPIN